MSVYLIDVLEWNRVYQKDYKHQSNRTVDEFLEEIFDYFFLLNTIVSAIDFTDFNTKPNVFLVFLFGKIHI